MSVVVRMRILVRFIFSFLIVCIYDLCYVKFCLNYYDEVNGDKNEFFLLERIVVLDLKIK